MSTPGMASEELVFEVEVSQFMTPGLAPWYMLVFPMLKGRN